MNLLDRGQSWLMHKYSSSFLSTAGKYQYRQISVVVIFVPICFAPPALPPSQNYKINLKIYLISETFLFNFAQALCSDQVKVASTSHDHRGKLPRQAEGIKLQIIQHSMDQHTRVQRGS